MRRIVICLAMLFVTAACLGFCKLTNPGNYIPQEREAPRRIVLDRDSETGVIRQQLTVTGSCYTDQYGPTVEVIFVDSELVLARQLLP